MNYRYDTSDRLTALAEPGGSCPATPAFPNSTKCTGFDYDKNDRRIGTKYPGRGEEHHPLRQGRPGHLDHRHQYRSHGLARRAYTYTYDAVQRLTGPLRRFRTAD